ncbi:Holliday junction resolvase [Candidatus Woesearchaeota archaeon]|nr:MAG: Holliday junction resolvase [Candidatus Woesearchaeota archaeon]
MSHKSKGTNAERELIHLFWAAGWASIRVAGSGSTKYPAPDVLAGNNIRRLAIECKSSKKEYVYLYKEEVGQLEEFCNVFGAEPWIGVRFDKQQWYFIPAQDLRDTGKRLRADLELVKEKGVIFDELIGLNL